MPKADCGDQAELFLKELNSRKQETTFMYISEAIDDYVSGFGYWIVRDLVGHGIGTQLQ